MLKPQVQQASILGTKGKRVIYSFFFFLKEQRVQGLIGMKKTGAKQAGETVLAVGVGK